MGSEDRLHLDHYLEDRVEWLNQKYAMFNHSVFPVNFIYSISQLQLKYFYQGRFKATNIVSVSGNLATGCWQLQCPTEAGAFGWLSFFLERNHLYLFQYQTPLNLDWFTRGSLTPCILTDKSTVPENFNESWCEHCPCLFELSLCYQAPFVRCTHLALGE